MKRVAFLILMLFATLDPVFGAKTIDLDSATIADINAAFNAGPLGMGTDTGGSIRGPSTANGIVGLKPTHGLLSVGSFHLR